MYAITVIDSVYFSTWLHKHKVRISDIDQLNCIMHATTVGLS